jgi:hypothetical protein
MAYDQFDVYISFAPEDSENARRVAEELEWLGIKVWYRDQPATSQESLQMLRGNLSQNRCQIVVWSQHSAASGRIQSEARAGSGLRKLIAVRFDDTIPPRDTTAEVYADLAGWTGGTDHKGMKKLTGAIWKLTGKGVQPEQVEGAAAPESTQTNFGGASPLNDDEKDERAWQTCLAYNTRTYYENYLRYFPTGRHVADAREKIAKKRRTGTIIATCAIIYIVVQIIVSLAINLSHI